MTPLQTRQAALAAALVSVLGSAVYFGFLGLPRLPAGRAEDFLGLVAALAGAVALALVHRLADKRALRVAPAVRSGVETALGGLIFLYVLYHLSHTLRFAGPVALAIDALIPAPVLHFVALVPGLVAAALTEAVWRRPATPRGRAGLKKEAGR